MGAAAQRILAYDAIAKMQIDMRPGAEREESRPARPASGLTTSAP